MPAGRYDRTYRCHSRGYVWLAGRLLDQILDWLTNIRLVHGGSVSYTPSGIWIAIPPPPVPMVIVKLTAAKDMSGYYQGDVYGNGTQEAVTAEDVAVALRGFDVDVTDDQGCYLATPVFGEDATYEVVGQMPIPPATGTHYLRVVDGVIKWIEAGTC